MIVRETERGGTEVQESQPYVNVPLLCCGIWLLRAADKALLENILCSILLEGTQP